MKSFLGNFYGQLAIFSGHTGSMPRSISVFHLTFVFNVHFGVFYCGRTFQKPIEASFILQPTPLYCFTPLNDTDPVWPDWEIFESSCQHIFFKRRPKIWWIFGLILKKQLFKKTAEVTLGSTFAKIGQRYFLTSGHTGHNVKSTFYKRRTNDKILFQ